MPGIIRLVDVQTRETEGNDHDDAGRQPAEPIPKRYHQRAVLCTAVEDRHGQCEQGQRHKNRVKDRRRPGHWDQKQDVPVHQRRRPVQQYLQPDVIEDVPDGEDEHEIGDRFLAIAAEEPGGREDERQRRRLAPDFRQQQVPALAVNAKTCIGK